MLLTCVDGFFHVSGNVGEYVQWLKKRKELFTVTVPCRVSLVRYSLCISSLFISVCVFMCFMLVFAYVRVYVCVYSHVCGGTKPVVNFLYKFCVDM